MRCGSSYGRGTLLHFIEPIITVQTGCIIISIPAASVTPMSSSEPQTSWLGLGITAYTGAEERANCFIALKGLKLNGTYFDITNWDEETCAQPYYTSPSALEIYLTPSDEE